MSNEVVMFEQKGHIAILTLNRPEARNAMNPEVLVRLAKAWQRVHDDDSIRVAVITGNGPAFCAGMDLGSMIPLITGARPPEDEWDKAVVSDNALSYRATLRNFDTKKPVIAAINGFAIAGGMELVMGCDLRIAADTARFGLQEVKWAIFPGGGSTVRLPNQIPYARAMEVLLTGDQFPAQSMLEYGFLNYVVAEGEVLDRALEMAEKIAANGPLAVCAVRRSVREAIGVPESQALVRESELSAPVYATEDAVEGPRAFMEKRQPVFKGR
jgi:enoyl-CoA hydratase